MKTIRNTSLLLMLGALLVAPILFIDGCAGTPNRVAYQTLVTTRVSVQEALGLFNVWVGEQSAKGVDTKPAELRVKAAFEKWKDGQLVVLEAARLNSVATSTNAAGGTGLSAVFEDAVSNAAQYKSDLLALLVSLGVKLPI